MMNVQVKKISIGAFITLPKGVFVTEWTNPPHYTTDGVYSSTKNDNLARIFAYFVGHVFAKTAHPVRDMYGNLLRYE